jgi:hypothetical protein
MDAIVAATLNGDSQWIGDGHDWRLRRAELEESLDASRGVEQQRAVQNQLEYEIIRYLADQNPRFDLSQLREAFGSPLPPPYPYLHQHFQGTEIPRANVNELGSCLERLPFSSQRIVYEALATATKLRATASMRTASHDHTWSAIRTEATQARQNVEGLADYILATVPRLERDDGIPSQTISRIEKIARAIAGEAEDGLRGVEKIQTSPARRSAFAWASATVAELRRRAGVGIANLSFWGSKTLARAILPSGYTLTKKASWQLRQANAELQARRQARPGR